MMNPSANIFVGSELQATSPPVVYHKTRMCRFFLMGSCMRGADCTWAHAQNELVEPPDFFRTQICHRFKNTGKCRNGHDCPFAHTRHQLRRPQVQTGKVERHDLSNASHTAACPGGFPQQQELARVDMGATEQSFVGCSRRNSTVPVVDGMAAAAPQPLSSPVPCGRRTSCLYPFTQRQSSAAASVAEPRMSVPCQRPLPLHCRGGVIGDAEVSVAESMASASTCIPPEPLPHSKGVRPDSMASMVESVDGASLSRAIPLPSGGGLRRDAVISVAESAESAKSCRPPVPLACGQRTRKGYRMSVNGCVGGTTACGGANSTFPPSFFHRGRRKDCVASVAESVSSSTSCPSPSLPASGGWEAPEDRARPESPISGLSSDNESVTSIEGWNPETSEDSLGMSLEASSAEEVSPPTSILRRAAPSKIYKQMQFPDLVTKNTKSHSRESTEKLVLRVKNTFFQVEDEPVMLRRVSSTPVLLGRHEAGRR
uniref:C3H1-type domain-containing protein n=1 Tax=Alexandrium monilatum TaxID=311494 RepID=A0A6T0UY62_9DINO|eukprot:CAMPEP_0175188770 /NCGR_PEP_ID=MMETSP0093-20121207/3589_1 /TAXON_ID=311494 /ORGANISM="Alexandrium monilatum, Strain CCMP3105" /LENGTH=484 /DNA_ID=CAMNT_0016481555 /DNA_START=139 /DNA_END=1593 /DNA_ORIENTATION=-